MIIVLGAFLYEWRVALISVIAIPLSLVAAGLVLYFIGATINTMVLAGFIVALGSLVDDAIIDVENIVRRLREHRKAGSAQIDRAHHSRSVARGAARHLPGDGDHRTGRDAGVLHGRAGGRVLRAAGARLHPRDAGFDGGGADRYAGAVPAAAQSRRHRAPGVAAGAVAQADDTARCSPAPSRRRARHSPRALVFVVAGVGGLAVPRRSRCFLTFKERDFLMHWVPAEGTSHPETFRITQQASRELRAIPGVRNFGAHIGRAVGGDEPYGVNFTENWISVDPKADYDKTRASIESAVDGYPGLYRDVQTYLRERIKEVLTGAGESIVVRIFGPELPVLRRRREEVQAGAEGHTRSHRSARRAAGRGSADTGQAESGRGGAPRPQARRRATRGGRSDVGHRSDRHPQGRQGVRRLGVVTAVDRVADVESIREFLIDTPYGGRVRLGEVADVEPRARRRTRSSAKTTRGASTFTPTSRAAIWARWPTKSRTGSRRCSSRSGTTRSCLGEYKERQAAQKNLLIFSLAAALAIFLILQASFGELAARQL